MRYLCLIYLTDDEMEAMPTGDMDALNARHLDFNDELAASGQMVEAEALAPTGEALCLRLRNGRLSVTDGPFIETKEQVAGFYLIEARDLNEAIQVAARIPSAHLATIEVRAIRKLVVPGRDESPFTETEEEQP